MAILVYIIFNIISIEELISGISNTSIITIFMLLIIASGLYKSYKIDKLFGKILITSRGYRPFLGSMMGLTATFSAFINNTAVVALMTPYVYDWGLRNNISPSKILIPLSYAAILGGMITIIGTSTTLVLNGFLESFEHSGVNQYYLFTTGIAASFACILFLILFAKYFLPDTVNLIDSFNTNYREYVVETRLSEDSSIIGKTVMQAGLRNLKDLFLAEIIRHGHTIKPVKPGTVLEKDDVLIFAGATEKIIDLTNSNKGIELPEKPEWISEKERITEVVISHNSSQIGKKINNSDFRKRYDSVVIGVFRNGERVKGKIGNVVINAGDALLMFSGKDFKEKADLYSDLFVISGSKKLASKANTRNPAWVLGIIALLAVLLGFGVINILIALIALFFYMSFTDHITLKTIKREFDLNLAGILILSLAIGKAMVNSGAGKLVAEFILNISSSYGEMGALLGLIIITVIFTTFITNVAAVSIAFPIAYELGNSTSINPDVMYVAIAFAASAAFLSPISYQTNLMIYGPGNYKFSDFTKIGIPVTIIYLVTVFLTLIVF